MEKYTDSVTNMTYGLHSNSLNWPASDTCDFHSRLLAWREMKSVSTKLSVVGFRWTELWTPNGWVSTTEHQHQRILRIIVESVRSYMAMTDCVIIYIRTLAAKTARRLESAVANYHTRIYRGRDWCPKWPSHNHQIVSTQAYIEPDIDCIVLKDMTRQLKFSCNT